MAQVRILSWNIQVYGPEKYGYSPNNVALIEFVGAVVNRVNANVVVLMEIMTSVGDQLGFNLVEALAATTGGAWEHGGITARERGDRETYAIFWRTDQEFRLARVAGRNAVGLAESEFPNNFSNTHGRRAAWATFSTNAVPAVNFTTTAYHAPPNARAIVGLQQLASMPQLYGLGGPPPAAPAVTGRLLCGDFNLDVGVQPDYTWLTNPAPAYPPLAAGQGAGCTEATAADTHLFNFPTLELIYGPPFAGWPRRTIEYRSAAAIDNIFYAPRGAPYAAGRVIDVPSLIVNGGAVRNAARRFRLRRPDGTPAFPYAERIGTPLGAALANVPQAVVFYRYAVSDHLPVFLSLNF